MADNKAIDEQFRFLMAYARDVISLWRERYPHEWMTMSCDIVDASCKEHGWDRLKCTVMYHLIAGSSPHVLNRHFDLEGDGSILKQLEADLASNAAEQYQFLRAKHPYVHSLEFDSGVYLIED